MSRRLAVVTACIRSAVESARPGPVRVISLCAGQSRDLVGALQNHPRRGEVSGRAVELDRRNAGIARAALANAGIPIDAVVGDAATTDAYVGAVPADVIVACGIFGNISDDDIRSTIGHFASLGAANATVVWTRHTRPPDLTPAIRGWFKAQGFEELEFTGPEDSPFGVGMHRMTATPQDFQAGLRLFDFVGDGGGA